MSILDDFCARETVQSDDYVIATYYIDACKEADVVQQARSYASGQTVGTWVEVQGLTQEMRRQYCAKIVDVVRLPPCDIITPVEERGAYLIVLAFPTVNFGANVAMMLTALLGNDASTSSQMKLIDMTIPECIMRSIGGPKYGVEGIRSRTAVPDRPLVMNMIKPCVGITPEQGGAIFYETALGGVDIIKDDELLGDTQYSPLGGRIIAYREAALRAQDKTGKRVLYGANITDRPDCILDNAKIAEDLGADLVMVSYSIVGFGTLEALAKSTVLPIIGHYAGSGYWSESGVTGVSAALVNGKLPRLCGADIVSINTPYGKYPLRYSSYIRVTQALAKPLPGIAPSLTCVGGGVHPGMVQRFASDLGNDILLAAGGAVQGHPLGAAEGAKAMVEAAEAAAMGIDVQERAKTSKALAAAIELWSTVA